MKKFSVICALLLSTGCQSIQDTAVEVDKALYTASEAVARRDDVTGERALNYISDAEEIKKGQEIFSAITAEAKSERILLGPGDPQYDRVQKIFERIIPVSHLKESKTAQFAVIDHDLFNAFAFGGGKLVVFTGLSNQLDDDELAIIIGHEIAHNTLSHLAEQEAGLTLKDAIDGGVQTGYSEAFSNLHEQQADQVGILYAALAGYDPYAGERLWSRLAVQSPKTYRYFLTHPSHKDRAKQNRQVADLVAKYYIADQPNPDAAQILVCNELYCKSDKPQIKGGEGGGLVALVEIIATTIKKNQQVKQELERQQREIAKQQVEDQRIARLQPPNIRWRVGWSSYEGTFERFGAGQGVAFGFTNNGRVGQFYFVQEKQLYQGNLVFYRRDSKGYWYRWNDSFGSGYLILQPYSDGSMRGTVYDSSRKPIGRWAGSK